jgi:hypothetical protein
MTRLVLALALATPLAAAAADAPRIEIFAGYSHARHESKETDGFLAAVDVGLGRSLGLELAVSGHYRSEGGESFSWTTLLAGPRYAWRGDRLTPFVHAEGGLVRSSAGIEVFDVSIRETATDFAAGVGGGLDIAFARSWAVRVQADYVFSWPEDGTEADPRASVGLVYRAGRR